MFNIELDLQETNTILAALQELPAKICNPLSEKIKMQAEAQIAAIRAAQQQAEQLISENPSE